MFQITIFFLYIIAATTFALGRLPANAGKEKPLLTVAYLAAIMGVAWHGVVLWQTIAAPYGLALTIGKTASLIGLQLALIGLLGASEATLRGLVGGLFLLAAFAAPLAGMQPETGPPGAANAVDWQIRSHVLISLFAYGLLSVGAIVALFALVQEKRLQAGKLSAVNQLFAPLETTEKLLFGITSGGFLALLLAVSSGFAFVDNLFAQHLVHKTALSLLALILFGILVAGRQFAGWRGKRAVYLYLWGFVILCLAYFGSRYVLEEVLGRSWS